MDKKNLRWLLRNLEREAQSALAKDASFLEALQCLKWQIDSDWRVKAAMRALRDRGLRVFSSFAPRIRIRLLVGETMLALPRGDARSNAPVAEDFGFVNRIASEPLIQELRDAASAVVAASLHCRRLDGIVNEAVRANSTFERIAAALERAGYEVQICLDLSTYAQVHEQGSAPTQLRGHQMSGVQEKKTRLPDSGSSSHLALSGRDLQFLKELRIRPD